MKKIMLVVIGVLLIAGCAGSRVYQRPGATLADFEKDKRECTYQAKLATASHSGTSIASGIEIGLLRVELFQDCMEVKGWMLQKEE